MTSSLWFSASAILPIMLLAAIGYLFKRFTKADEAFFSFLNQFVFQLALPVLVFLQLYDTDFSELSSDSAFLGFSVACMIVCYLGGMGFSALLVRDRRKTGAFAQGMTRSTFSIVGLPLAEGLFGAEGLRLAALLLPFAVILNNVFAVLMLSVFRPKERKEATKTVLLKMLKNILFNPLIDAMLLAVLFHLCSIRLPDLLYQTASGFSKVAQPLALICLGAGFAKEGLRGRVRLAIFASVLKTVVLPLAFGFLAIACGYRGAYLGVLCILFGGPTTISSYVMAKNMDADEVLTGQIVLLSTLMSAFTLFLLFFGLHELALV